MTRVIDITGERHNRWTVIRRVPNHDGGQARYLFRPHQGVDTEPNGCVMVDYANCNTPALESRSTRKLLPSVIVIAAP